MIDTAKFLELYKQIEEKAIELACAKRNVHKNHFERIEFYEDEIEVHFSESSGCSCCSDTGYWVDIKLSEINEDVDVLINKYDDERIAKEDERHTANLVKVWKDKKIKETKERLQYESLKKKFETV